MIALAASGETIPKRGSLRTTTSSGGAITSSSALSSSDSFSYIALGVRPSASFSFLLRSRRIVYTKNPFVASSLKNLLDITFFTADSIGVPLATATTKIGASYFSASFLAAVSEVNDFIDDGIFFFSLPSSPCAKSDIAATAKTNSILFM